jgi:hypothetical protein
MGKAHRFLLRLHQQHPSLISWKSHTRHIVISLLIMLCLTKIKHPHHSFFTYFFYIITSIELPPNRPNCDYAKISANAPHSKNTKIQPHKPTKTQSSDTKLSNFNCCKCNNMYPCLSLMQELFTNFKLSQQER